MKTVVLVGRMRAGLLLMAAAAPLYRRPHSQGEKDPAPVQLSALRSRHAGSHASTAAQGSAGQRRAAHGSARHLARRPAQRLKSWRRRPQWRKAPAPCAAARVEAGLRPASCTTAHSRDSLESVKSSGQGAPRGEKEGLRVHRGRCSGAGVAAQGSLQASRAAERASAARQVWEEAGPAGGKSRRGRREDRLQEGSCASSRRLHQPWPGL